MSQIVFILLIWPIAQMAQRRGISSILCGVWLGVCILGGEVLGFVVGHRMIDPAVVMSDPDKFLLCFSSLLGSVAGASVAFLVAWAIPPVDGVWREPQKFVDLRTIRNAVAEALAACGLKRLIIATTVFLVMIFSGLWFGGWFDGPSPYRLAYRAIPFNMPKAELETLLTDLGAPGGTGYNVVRVDIEGRDGFLLHAGERLAEESAERSNNPDQSRLLRLGREMNCVSIGTDQFAYRDPVTGHDVATSRMWRDGSEAICVVFDADGVLEKWYYRYRPEPLLEKFRKSLGPWWPF